MGVQGPRAAILNRMVKESFTKMSNDQKPTRDEEAKYVGICGKRFPGRENKRKGTEVGTYLTTRRATEIEQRWRRGDEHREEMGPRLWRAMHRKPREESEQIYFENIP